MLKRGWREKESSKQLKEPSRSHQPKKEEKSEKGQIYRLIRQNLAEKCKKREKIRFLFLSWEKSFYFCILIYSA